MGGLEHFAEVLVSCQLGTLLHLLLDHLPQIFLFNLHDEEEAVLELGQRGVKPHEFLEEYLRNDVASLRSLISVSVFLVDVAGLTQNRDVPKLNVLLYRSLDLLDARVPLVLLVITLVEVPADLLSVEFVLFVLLWLEVEAVVVHVLVS